MSGITAIHHPLRHVQARPSEIRTIVHINHTADRATMHTHAQFEFGLFL